MESWAGILLVGTLFLMQVTCDFGNGVTPLMGRSAVVNEYWCWRAKYCHVTNNKVCARDSRLNQWHIFQCECTMYKHNCDAGHDFTATTAISMEKCLENSNT